jgi:hypothetical protein
VTLSAPVTLVGDGATTPALAHDPHAGGSVLTWVETRDGESNVYLVRVAATGEGLSDPVRVNSVPGDASTHEQAPPQAAVGPGGEVYVVWQKSRPIEGRRYDASDLRFSWSTDAGATFAPALTVNDDAGGRPSSHTFHNIAVAPDGRVYVSWLDGREQDRVRAEMAASGGQGAHAGHGAHGAPGALPGSDIRVASWTPGAAAFTPATVVDGNVCPCCRTSLAVGADGTVYVGWRKVFEGNVRDVVVARSTNGGRTFGTPVPVHRDGWVFEGCPHAGPSLAIDASGRLFVAWYTGLEGSAGVFFAVSEPGDLSFGPPAPLLADAWVPPAIVSLAPAPHGGVWAAWDDRRGETRFVRAAFLDGGEVRMLGDSVPGYAPALAAGPQGASVVWKEGATLKARGLQGSPN